MPFPKSGKNVHKVPFTSEFRVLVLLALFYLSARVLPFFVRFTLYIVILVNFRGIKNVIFRYRGVFQGPQKG